MNNDTTSLRAFIGFVFIGALAVGCSHDPPTQDPASEPVAPAPQLTQSPLIGLAPGDEKSFSGVVNERLVAGPYLYFGVDAAEGRRWVATLRTSGAKLGDWVNVSSFGVRENFMSKRLDRTFERVHFGIVRRQNDEARASQQETRP